MAHCRSCVLTDTLLLSLKLWLSCMASTSVGTNCWGELLIVVTDHRLLVVFFIKFAGLSAVKPEMSKSSSGFHLVKVHSTVCLCLQSSFWGKLRCSRHLMEACRPSPVMAAMLHRMQQQQQAVPCWGRLCLLTMCTLFRTC